MAEDNAKITISLDRYDQTRIDEMVGTAITASLNGTCYDEEGDEYGSEDRLKKTAQRLIEERVDKALKGWLEERIKALVEERVQAVIDGGAYKAPGWDGHREKNPTVAEMIEAIITRPQWDSPKDWKGDRGNSMNLVQFVAWKAASGQISEKAREIASTMTEQLTAEIANTLGEQMARRMLGPKGK